jgi:hypothetical protein
MSLSISESDRLAVFVILYGQRRLIESRLTLPRTWRKVCRQFRDRDLVLVDATWRNKDENPGGILKGLPKGPRCFEFGKPAGQAIEVPDIFLNQLSAEDFLDSKPGTLLPAKFASQFLSVSQGAAALRDWLEVTGRKYRADSPVLTLRTDVIYGGKFPSHLSNISVSNFRHDSFDDNSVVTPLGLLSSLDLINHLSQSTVSAASPEEARSKILRDLKIGWQSRNQPYFIIRKSNKLHVMAHFAIVSMQYATRMAVPWAHDLLWSPVSSLKRQIAKIASRPRRQ